ncbi:MAG: hypothetical protein KatS3mg040_1648 [Candidatus Kapaibacterium sp.]|nr:MAG: hypothetical protein KatS3mg040_1648 [Candidatus Kapabacteria bacterium]
MKTGAKIRCIVACCGLCSLVFCSGFLLFTCSMSHSVLVWLFLCWMYSLALAATPYEQLLARIAHARSITCTAIADEGETIRIVATRQGKFRLESNEQQIVCNGEVVWNYRPATKTVTIAPVSQQALNDLFRLADKIAADYRATNATSSMVVLRPSNRGAMYGIEQLELRFRGNRLHTVTITRANGTKRWRIRALEFDRSTSDSTFVFVPPAGVEVIDMR